MAQPWRQTSTCCHSPSLSHYRCDLHILLNAVSILLFGVINPLPLLDSRHTQKRQLKTFHHKNCPTIRSANVLKASAAWWCLRCSSWRWGQSKSFRGQRATLMGRGERSWSLARLFHVLHTYWPLRQLKKALPAVSLSAADLRSMCSKIRALLSAAHETEWLDGADPQHTWMHMHAFMHRQKGRGSYLEP